jgi:hypothetical protein
MPQFRVEATANAQVKATTYVEADNEEDAAKVGQTFFESGEAEWKYDGADDSTIEVQVTDGPYT